MLVQQTSEITLADILAYNIAEDEHAAYDPDREYLAGERCIADHAIYQAVVGNATEGIPAWDEAVAFAAGGKCYVAETHRIYQANVDTTGQYPPNYLAGSNPVWTQVGYRNLGVALTDDTFWLQVSATNAWGAFDAYCDTQTVGVVAEGGGYLIDVTISMTRCNSIAFFNCAGDTVSLELLSQAGDVLWSETVALVQRNSRSWTDYFFNPRALVRKNFYRTFPVHYGSRMRVRIHGRTAARVGMITRGYMRSVNRSLFPMRLSINDYSTKETNSFGVTYFKKGRYKQLVTVSARVDVDDLDWFNRFFTDLRSTPTVYVCDNGQKTFSFESSLVFGVYNDFQVDVPGPVYCDCSLQIEGLV